MRNCQWIIRKVNVLNSQIRRRILVGWAGWEYFLFIHICHTLWKVSFYSNTFWIIFNAYFLLHQSLHDLTNPTGRNLISILVLTNVLGHNLISILGLTNPLGHRLILALVLTYQPSQVPHNTLDSTLLGCAFFL